MSDELFIPGNSHNNSLWARLIKKATFHINVSCPKELKHYRILSELTSFSAP